MKTRKKIQPAKIKRNLRSQLEKKLDLQNYKELFPLARSITRKHTLLVGPTNSGKTYNALNLLTSYETGAYLSPLRLLALEVQEEIEKRGKACSLLTGDEQDIREGASFMASTIELLSTEKIVDAILIDEAQLISDQQRGWAWTKAIVGAPAKHIIMTGSPDSIPALRALIEDYLGEELEIIEKQRNGILECLPAPSRQLQALEKGTAIIAFSRKNVLGIKYQIERSGRKASVLYGNLSPSARREEARRFREGESDLMVATDCIGMGLNLPIKTVIFSTVAKFDGKEERDLHVQEIKQIAGRAGRFGMFEKGTVGAASKTDLRYIRWALRTDAPHNHIAYYISPTYAQLEDIAAHMEKPINLYEALEMFQQLRSEDFSSFDLEQPLQLAAAIEHDKELNQLPREERYEFIFSPVSNKTLADHYLNYLRNYARKEVTPLETTEIQKLLRNQHTNADHILLDAEICLKKLTIYRWLARKRPELFPDLALADELGEKLNTFIEQSLKQKNFAKRCPRCSRELNFFWPHRMCDDCYEGPQG